MVLIGQLTDAAALPGSIRLRIVGKQIQLTGTCIDSGIRYKLQFESYGLMYYMLRFFGPDTRHKFRGICTSTAYNIDGNSRPFVSNRMVVDGVQPIIQVDENNEIVVTEARRMHNRDFNNDDNKKLKYMVFKYAWQHIDNGDVVSQQRLNKESFSEVLGDLHYELVDLGIIPNGEDLCPVVAEERLQARAVGTGSRPRPRVRDIVYVWNNLVPTVDWGSNALSLILLRDDTVPFPADVMGNPPIHASRSSATTVPSSSHESETSLNNPPANRPPPPSAPPATNRRRNNNNNMDTT